MLKSDLSFLVESLYELGSTSALLGDYVFTFGLRLNTVRRLVTLHKAPNLLVFPLRELLECLAVSTVTGLVPINTFSDSAFLIAASWFHMTFSLLGSDLILACPDEGSCLDFEQQPTHYVLLVGAQGKRSSTVYVKINVLDVNDNRPRLQASNHFIRLSHNRLIMPFIVEVDVRGFAPLGRHQLDITVSDGNWSDTLVLEVQVQNSYSNAHFRREKYSRSITADKVHPGNQLLQVELEGIPIDEAHFVILSGNPGWLSIDDYGGRVRIDSYVSEVEAGNYLVGIGAVARQNDALLARTLLEITVVGESTSESKLFSHSLYERVLDRESSSEFSVPFKLRRNAVVGIGSAFAIDEDGQQRDFHEGDLTISKEAIVFRKRSLVDLRVVSVQLVSERKTATVILTLTSSPEFIESRRKELARPVFPPPWTREDSMIELSISEELPPGHIIYTLPAVNPMDGSLVSLAMEGDMKEMFAVDSTTGRLLGAISVVQRLDFESLSPSERTFSLRFSAGLLGYEAESEIRISILNVDDNAPIVEKDGMLDEVR
uniref:Cadherin domain protein n=1 Tax=Angiostrongylus cantonensis TaxID=6313 RepID=A0A0K0D245_ANGCA